MATPSEVISLAKISEYLWNSSIPKERVFFNGTIDPRKPVQLYMEWKALQYGNDQNLVNGTGSNPQTLQGVANYVYALCGAKIGIAQEILNNGSSGGSVVPGGGGQGVREYSKFAVEGTASITFSEAVNTTLLYASRGGIDVGTILTSGVPTANQVSWNSSTGTLTVSSDVAFYLNEFVRILVK
jgi:hypothetical protein